MSHFKHFLGGRPDSRFKRREEEGRKGKEKRSWGNIISLMAGKAETASVSVNKCGNLIIKSGDLALMAELRGY